MKRWGAFLLFLSLIGAAGAQVATNVPPVVANAKAATVQVVTIHGDSLVGNLEGESADRPAVIVLPPSYASSPQRRYPVVYALHGFSIGAQQWTQEIHVPQTVEGAFGKGAQEMIVVFPDSKTAYGGSFYSSSAAVGDFETYVSRDVVRYVDAHFRTLADRLSRGLAGHSMGGYGAARIGMHHPEVFGALYIMSGCCLSPMQPNALNADAVTTIQSLKKPQDAAGLPFPILATLATAAAWSPNPQRPPLYLDLPLKDGAVQTDVAAKWAANAPLAFVDQAIGNLRQYTAIAIDVGDQDGLKADATKLHATLDSYGIVHTFEVYSGTHTSNVAFRFQDFVLPFFSAHLRFH